MSDLIKLMENILGHITGINDKRDTVGILLAIKEHWPLVRDELEHLRAENKTLRLQRDSANIRADRAGYWTAYWTAKLAIEVAEWKKRSDLDARALDDLHAQLAAARRDARNIAQAIRALSPAPATVDTSDIPEVDEEWFKKAKLKGGAVAPLPPTAVGEDRIRDLIVRLCKFINVAGYTDAEEEAALAEARAVIAYLGRSDDKHSSGVIDAYGDFHKRGLAVGEEEMAQAIMEAFHMEGDCLVLTERTRHMYARQAARNVLAHLNKAASPGVDWETEKRNSEVANHHTTIWLPPIQWETEP